MKFKNKQIKEKLEGQDVMRDANMQINAILEENGLMIVNTLVRRPVPKETTAQATTKEQTTLGGSSRKWTLGLIQCSAQLK